MTKIDKMHPKTGRTLKEDGSTANVADLIEKLSSLQDDDETLQNVIDKNQKIKTELELVKSELETIKANQTSGDQKAQLHGSNVAEQLTNNDATSPFEGETEVDGDTVTITVETTEDLNQIVIEDNGDENESVTFAGGTITLDLDNTDTYNDDDIATLIESDTDITSATVEGQSDQKASSEWLDTISMGGTTLTFSDDIESIEIWHDEIGLETFVVNGIALEVGPGGWRSPVGGTPSTEVTIPEGITCAVARLV